MRALFSILFFATFAFAETDVEFVFDVSGSMAKKLNGEAQIDIARRSLINTLKDIPSDELVAVRAFAHRVEQTNKSESCKDTELIVPFAKPDIGSIALSLASLSPKGYTPIAYSLEKAAEDMIAAGKTREPKRVIILLSDGEETCDGDAVAVLKRLKDQGFDVIVHTIGFNVGETARQQLKAIAAFSGGKYFDARDESKLSEAFEEATKETYFIEKKKEEVPTTGIEIRGGDGYKSAVEFQKEWSGVELQLDHHLKGKEHDYFYLDIEENTHVHLTVKNLEKTLRIGKNGVPQELMGASPAMIMMHDGDFKKIMHVYTYGGDSQKFTSKSGYISIKDAGRYYFRFGANGSQAVHKDGASYWVRLEKKGDLDSDKDAGPSLRFAMPIEVNKTYELSHLGGSYQKFDTVDMYKVNANKGDKLTFLYNSLLDEKWPEIRFDVVNEFNERVAHTTRGKGIDAPMKGEFIAPEDGVFYVSIMAPYVRDMAPYSLKVSLEKAEVAEE